MPQLFSKTLLCDVVESNEHLNFGRRHDLLQKPAVGFNLGNFPSAIGQRGNVAKCIIETYHYVCNCCIRPVTKESIPCIFFEDLHVVLCVRRVSVLFATNRVDWSFCSSAALFFLLLFMASSPESMARIN
jgi:hypothetical protein